MTRMSRMKKIAALLMFAFALLTVPAFSEEMSFGGALYFLGDFGGGAEFPKDPGVSGLLNHDTYVTPVYGVGLSPFFDARYVEASLGLFIGGGRWVCKDNGKEKLGVTGFYHDASITSFNIDILGKYPIPVSGRDNMSMFPLAGIAYHLVVAGEGGVEYGEGASGKSPFDGKGNYPSAGDLSAFWIKFGGGLDYDINEKIYARGALLYGIRLSNAYETETLLKDAHDIRNQGKARLGHGLTIKAGLGFYM